MRQKMCLAERWDLSDNALGHWIVVAVTHTRVGAMQLVRKHLEAQEARAWKGLPMPAPQIMKERVDKEFKTYRFRFVHTGEMCEMQP